jgi:HlyD family secretion protein
MWWERGLPPQVSQAEKLPVQDLLQRFDLLSPAARFELVCKVDPPDKQFQPASRGDVFLPIVVRGLVESADSAGIYCKVRSTTKGSVNATTVKSIVDNGVQVRKGDVLVHLDDSGFQEQLRDKTKVYQRALADSDAAKVALDVQRLQNQANEVASEIAIRTAELALKKYAGNDPEEKEILKLNVEKARLSVQLAKAAGKLRLIQAEANLREKRANADAELVLLNSIKDQIEQCTIKAPKDGVTVFFIPEKSNNGGQRIVDQGEPVREGQKLLEILDLNNMVVTLYVPDALASYLRSGTNDKSKGQEALVKVDVFPDTVLKGHVTFVSDIAKVKSGFRSLGADLQDPGRD